MSAQAPSRVKSRSKPSPTRSLALELSTAALLAALVIVPAYFNIQSSISFEPDKGALLYSLALVAIAPLIVGWVRQWRTGWRPRWRDIPLPLRILVGVGLTAALATLLGADFTTSLWGNHERGYGLLTVLAGCCFLIVAYQAARAGQTWLVIDAILLGAVVPTIYGLVQVFGQDPVRGQTISFPLGQRASSSLGNPLYLADFLLITLLLTVARLTVGSPRGSVRAGGAPPFWRSPGRGVGHDR